MDSPNESEHESIAIIDFLKSRGLSKDSLYKIKDEKIDFATFIVLSDEQLKTIIPVTLGDLHAAKRFCSDALKKNKQKARCTSLIKKWKRKTKAAMKLKTDKSDSTTGSDNDDGQPDRRRIKLVGNQNASKIERKIELGWFDYDFKSMEYHQVKTLIKGGGTRGVSALKTWKPKDILEHGKKIFFPKGVSKRGKLSDFTFELRDFSAQAIPNESTVGDMYESTDVKMLRYYIFTKRKADQSYDSDETYSPKLKSSKNSKAKNRVYSDDEDSLPELELTARKLQTSDEGKSPRSPGFEFTKGKTTPTSKKLHTVEEKQWYSLPDLEIPVENTTQPPGKPQSNVERQLQKSDTSAVIGPDIPSTSTAYMIVDNDVKFRLTDENANVVTVNNPSELVSFYIGSYDSGDITLPLEFAIENVGEDLAMSSFTSVSTAQKVRFHQGNTYQELIDHYKNKDFRLEVDENLCKVERVLPNGETEKGEGIGLLRDIFTEFWDGFYSKCDGHDVKIPILRHNMGEEEWKAVGRIIVDGYKLMDYFPIKLAKPMVEDAFFGESQADLIEEFLHAVSPVEQTVLRNAMSSFNDVDFEELCDILSSHDCLKLPSAENIRDLVKEISHKEILQEPKFVIECWKPVFQTDLHITRSKLDEIYDKKLPTVKKLLQLMKFPSDMDFIQKTTANHLKRFVRSLNKQALEAFIRFCTGSNILGAEISIEFNKMSGFGRRPTARTCGCVLSIPVTYDSYTEMREEFNNILSSNVWEMGYV